MNIFINKAPIHQIMTLEKVIPNTVTVIDFNKYLLEKARTNYGSKVTDSYIEKIIGSKNPKDLDELKQYGINEKHISNYIQKSIIEKTNSGILENPLERILRYNTRLESGFNLDRPKDLRVSPQLELYLKDNGPDVTTVMRGTREKYALDRTA